MDLTASTQLGRSRTNISGFGLGTAPLGGLVRAVQEEVAAATVRAALDAGIRLFDTAPLYGLGLAEERLGRALAGVPRERVVVSTKVGRVLVSAEPGRADPLFVSERALRAEFDFSYEGALRSVEASLERLGLDRLDIVLLHDPDDHFREAVAGSLQALSRLRDDRLVGAIGVGTNTSETAARFVRECDLDFVLLAGRYTLLDQIALRELLPLCAERGVSVIAAGVFNSGVLARPGGDATYEYEPATAAVLRRVERLDAICRRHGVPLAAAALQFPARHPAVAASVAGARSPAEVQENVECFRCEIPRDLWAELKAERLLPPDAPTE